MRCFRIDNREKCVGDILLPQGVYQYSLDKERLEVEELLESFRPKDKPKRDSILMLFSDFGSAKNHWLKQKNSKFYQIEIENHEILHKGDYRLVEQIFSSLQSKNNSVAKALACKYWESKITETSIVEIFVNKATITKVISASEEQRKNEILFKHRKVAPDIKPNPKIERVVEND
jgi:hypothetical protein